MLKLKTQQGDGRRIRRRTLPEQVVDQLGQRIVRGDFARQGGLPTEPKLSGRAGHQPQCAARGDQGSRQQGTGRGEAQDRNPRDGAGSSGMSSIPMSSAGFPSMAAISTTPMTLSNSGASSNRRRPIWPPCEPPRRKLPASRRRWRRCMPASTIRRRFQPLTLPFTAASTTRRTTPCSISRIADHAAHAQSGLA